MSWPREYDMETVHNMMHFSPTRSQVGDNKLHVILLRYTKKLEVLKETRSFIEICLQFKYHLVVQGRLSFEMALEFFVFYLGKI